MVVLQSRQNFYAFSGMHELINHSKRKNRLRGPQPLLSQYLALRGLTMLPAYSNAETAEVFECSSRTILNWTYKGWLKPRSMPGRKTFLPCDLEDMLQRRPS